MPQTNPFPLVAIVTTVFALTPHPANAGQELFSVNTAAQDGSGLSLTVSSSSFYGLINDAVKAQNSFAVFQNRPDIASLSYADIPNAVTFQQNQAGTQAVLRIPLTGLVKVFTGTSRSDVNQQIVNFLKSNGADEYAKFLAALNKHSKVSPLDGNPNSATAQISATTFSNFGFPTPENASGNGRGGSILGDVGRFTAGSFRGEALQLPLSFTLHAWERVSIVVNVPLSYMKVEGSEVFNAGMIVSVPVRLRQASPPAETGNANGKTAVDSGERWTWQVTPTVGAIGSGSPDFGTAGLIGEVALTNMTAYNFDHVTLAIGNQFCWLQSIPIRAAGYSVSSGVSQFVLKNGLQLSAPIGNRWLASAYGIYTRFVEDAAVQDYVTLGAEVGYKILPTVQSYVKLGFYSDIGSHYTSGNIRFGTGWKF